MTPKGGEPGSWLSLILNKQLFCNSRGYTVVLRERLSLGNEPRGGENTGTLAGQDKGDVEWRD